MAKLPDLQIHINGQHTFFLNQRIVSASCGMLRKLIKQEKKNTQIKNGQIHLEIDGFPGTPDGFELISSFCYNSGVIPISTSNVSALHCGAIFLGMNEKVPSCNLLQQTETFLEGMLYWSWYDIVICLKSCESFFEYADSAGLIEKLIFSLLSKIAHNSDINLMVCSSSSSFSSPENGSGDSKNRINGVSVYYNPITSASTGKNRAWWFDDLSTLSPKIIERMIKSLGAYGPENNSLILTKFLLHYLKAAAAVPPSQYRGLLNSNYSSYSGLADTAVHGVTLMGKTAFSCRSLFWVMRVVSSFGLSESCRAELERLIGTMLDQAKLDDLLVCGGTQQAQAPVQVGGGGIYDVNLVGRLIRLFVGSDGVSAQRMRQVGWLIDQYLGEISPDPNLKVSKFMVVAQSLPDSARDCFDGVYRAIDIYLESHPHLSPEERSRLCRCLSFKKLSLEACKDLAKNPRIPPQIAVEALAAQPAGAKDYNYERSSGESPNNTTTSSANTNISNNNNNDTVMGTRTGKSNCRKIVVVHKRGDHRDVESIEGENEDMRVNIKRMQGRVMELEKMCREMKGQMSNLVIRQRSLPRRPSPRLC